MVKSVDQLREIFAIGNDKFKLYGNFKAKILVRACKEINDNYELNLKFEEIKKGRKVIAVKFSFKKTLVYQVTNQGIVNIFAKIPHKPAS